MTCSADPDAEALAAARRLSGRPVTALHPLGRSGNSRVYRVVCAQGECFALKSYPHDNRARLQREVAALTFLAAQGCEQVPRVLAADAEGGFGLFQWIDGNPPLPARAAALDEAAAFADHLRQLAASPDAAALPPAAEATLSGAEILRQIETRLSRLAACAEGELTRLLARDLPPLLAKATAHAIRSLEPSPTPFDHTLPRSRQTLSPSDFGFHNALRRPDGGLVFLDFEYFGWDDPVRLAADFLCHPGMALTAPQRRRFAARIAGVFGHDLHFTDRLQGLTPLIALRWCMIILNPFLPDRRTGWPETQWRDMADRQLAKARRQLRFAAHALRNPPP
jgi:hypothetical protein